MCFCSSAVVWMCVCARFFVVLVWWFFTHYTSNRTQILKRVNDFCVIYVPRTFTKKKILFILRTRIRTHTHSITVYWKRSAHKNGNIALSSVWKDPFAFCVLNLSGVKCLISQWVTNYTMISNGIAMLLNL